MRRGYVVVLAFVLLIGVLGFIIFKQVNSKVTFKFDIENTKKIEITKIASESDPDSPKNDTKSLSTSSKIKLDKNTSYLVKYYGAQNYEDGYKVIDTSKQQEEKISPYYSETKLNQNLSQNIDSIHNVINSKYPTLASLYKFSDEKLYHYGEWYSAKLTYAGNDIFNSDSLFIILNMDNNRWNIVTDPPQIFISKVDYPKIPTDIVQKVNNF